MICSPVERLLTLDRYGLGNHVDFNEQYARARSAQAEAMFEDMLAIADDGSQDRVMVDGKLRVDNEIAARSRLRVDTRRWALSKLAPVKYGEKVTNILEWWRAA